MSELNKKIVEMLLKGYPKKYICEKLKCADSTIRCQAHLNGIKLKREMPRFEEIMRYCDKHGHDETIKHFGITENHFRVCKYRYQFLKD